MVDIFDSGFAVASREGPFVPRAKLFRAPRMMRSTEHGEALRAAMIADVAIAGDGEPLPGLTGGVPDVRKAAAQRGPLRPVARVAPFVGKL